MSGIKYTNETPIVTPDNKWEVTVSASEGKDLKRDEMLQTATYAFYVDKSTLLENGKYLLNLTPRA